MVVRVAGSVAGELPAKAAAADIVSAMDGKSDAKAINAAIAAQVKG